MSKMEKWNDLFKIIYITREERWKIDPDLKLIKEYLNEHMQIRVVKEGEKIHQYDKTQKYIHYVIVGKYFHYRELKIGKRNLIALNEAPEWIGMDRVLDKENANITEDYVTEECIVIDIEKEYFVECLKNNGEISLYIIKNLLKKMSLTSNRAESMLINDAKLQFLCWLNDYWKNNNKGEEKLIIKLKNDYIMDNIGISTRTFYRILKELKEEGLIATIKGNIVINNLQIEKIKNIL
ncbi:MAG: Crp/Fnr family transcriptional regulator [Cetobacterium sp.]|uniref:Crp/Fnr family transcriptional regulator n=1 Tax=Cetobacterium sp. TaxID=2071632 RepID=UPI003EE52124